MNADGVIDLTLSDGPDDDEDGDDEEKSKGRPDDDPMVVDPESDKSSDHEEEDEEDEDEDDEEDFPYWKPSTYPSSKVRILLTRLLTHLPSNTPAYILSSNPYYYTPCNMPVNIHLSFLPGSKSSSARQRQRQKRRRERQGKQRQEQRQRQGRGPRRQWKRQSRQGQTQGGSCFVTKQKCLFRTEKNTQKCSQKCQVDGVYFGRRRGRR